MVRISGYMGMFFIHVRMPYPYYLYTDSSDDGFSDPPLVEFFDVVRASCSRFW